MMMMMMMVSSHPLHIKTTKICFLALSNDDNTYIIYMHAWPENNNVFKDRFQWFLKTSYCKKRISYADALERKKSGLKSSKMHVDNRIKKNQTTVDIFFPSTKPVKYKHFCNSYCAICSLNQFQFPLWADY